VGAVVFLIYILPLATADWTEKKRRKIRSTYTCIEKDGAKECGLRT